ncbi:hypothetical protein [Alteromonas stellipolaris]|jgi:hypothetical protein|uniref:hypothetical protein n=1 Tax=Alteromonas stellipolaris TaxID=233316 RepID=UPI0026E2BD30|nr:hypothetical protein [Alteromonas stellipolaris]MDO6536035.1 hypothetical protein [Alteromonas stellipolaris]MDO6627943.1 hypothetical protein [Alteromonas stellipolaris]
MNKRILIIGDSHTHSLKRYFKVDGQDQDIEVLTFAKVKNDVLVGDELLEDVKKRLQTRSSEYKAVVSFTGGNQHNSVSLIQHKKAFSIASIAGDNYVGEGSAKLPREALKYVFNKGLRGGDFKKLKGIIDSCDLPVYHVAAPPPKKSTAHILERPESDFVRRNIVDNGVTDAYVRLEVYKAQIEVTRQLCAEFGITFVELPGVVTDSDGFLDEKYYADDATHANKDFAEIMVANLKSLID